MEEFTSGGRTIRYEVVRTAKKKEYFCTELRDGIIYIRVPMDADKQTVKLVLRQQFLNLYYKVHPEEWHVVHFLGKVYHADCRVGKKTGVTLEGDRMIIRAAKDTTHAYRCVLLAFFKRAVEKELVSLIYDAEFAFRDISFPKISVKTIRGYWGYNYKNAIVLSPQIARYEVHFIKALLYHELCHSLIRGHGEDFWAMFERKLPGGLALGEERNALAYDTKDYL